MTHRDCGIWYFGSLASGLSDASVDEYNAREKESAGHLINVQAL